MAGPKYFSIFKTFHLFVAICEKAHPKETLYLSVLQYLINVESIAEEKHDVRVCGEPSDLGISGLNLDNERYTSIVQKIEVQLTFTQYTVRQLTHDSWCVDFELCTFVHRVTNHSL